MTTPRRTADIAKEVDQIPISHKQETMPTPKVIGDTWIREEFSPYDADENRVEVPAATLSAQPYPTNLAVASGRLTLSRQSLMNHRRN